METSVSAAVLPTCAVHTTKKHFFVRGAAKAIFSSFHHLFFCKQHFLMNHRRCHTRHESVDLLRGREKNHRKNVFAKSFGPKCTQSSQSKFNQIYVWAVL